MVEISKTYPEPPPSAIASFDNEDIVSGLGYVDFYIIESQTDSGLDYHLITRRDFSNTEKITKSTSTSDLDYDSSPFNSKRTINGVALISLAVVSTSGNSPTYTVELYRVRSGAETQIGSTLVFQVSLTVAKMFYMPMTITNEKFKKGDIVEYKGEKIRIMSIHKKVFAKNIKTGKKLNITFKDMFR